MIPTATRSRLAVLLTALAFVIAVLPTGPGPFQPTAIRADTDDDVALAARHLLTQSTIVDRRGTHNLLLKAVRHMQDPATRPLFEYLATSDHPAMKIHGILGLAELSDNRQIDLALVAQMDDAAAQSTCLTAAMDNKLLSNEQARQLLAWDSLDDEVKVLVAVRLLEQDEFSDVELCLHALSGSKKLGGSALAALLLVQLDDPRGLAYLRNNVDASDDPQRDAVRAMLLQTALRHSFDRIGSWASDIADDPQSDPILALLALRTCLRFNEPGAVQRWQQWYERSHDSPATRIRLALTALYVAPWTGPELFSSIQQSDDPMIRAIGQAGMRVTTHPEDAGDAIAALLEFGHPMINAWALDYAQDHASEIDTQVILLGLILAYEHSEPRGRARRLDEAVQAVQALYERAPDTAAKLLQPILTDPNTDKLLEQAILLGLVRIQSDAPAGIVDGLLDQIQDPDARSLALLLLARSDIPMNDQQMRDLALLARGGGKLEDSLRIQAAWAYLTRIGRAQQTLAACLEKTSHE